MAVASWRGSPIISVSIAGERMENESTKYLYFFFELDRTGYAARCLCKLRSMVHRSQCNRLWCFYLPRAFSIRRDTIDGTKKGQHNGKPAVSINNESKEDVTDMNEWNGYGLVTFTPMPVITLISVCLFAYASMAMILPILFIQSDWSFCSIQRNYHQQRGYFQFGCRALLLFNSKLFPIGKYLVSLECSSLEQQ